MKKSSKAFMNALKKVTDQSLYVVTNKQAKNVVMMAIKASGAHVKDVLDYITDICDIPSSFTDEEWKSVINYHRNWNGKLGKLLKNFKNISLEEFSTLATGCSLNAAVLLKENKVDEFGWQNVLDTLKEECKGIKEETAVAVPATPATPAMKEEVPVSSKTKSVILMKDEDGNCVAEYKTILEAEKKTGISHASISKNLHPETYPGYKHLKSKIDGKKYTFEFKKTPVPVTAKATRSYTRNKIVVLNKETSEVTTYENTKLAASALGVKPDEIYYRAKAENHSLNETYEVWNENLYNASKTTAMAA